MVAKFEIRRENKLPATPEQVWDAVATSSGNLCWLFPMQIEPWAGGAVSHGPSTVTVWDPPRQFSCRHDEEGFSAVLEYLIEADEGESTILRTIIRREHSGVVGADWKTQIDGAKQHTDFYHHTLEQYLRYFPGRPASYLQAAGPAAATATDAFTVLRRGLGLTDDLAAGDAVRLTPLGLDPVDAVVDYLTPHFLGLRSTGGLHRFFGRNAWGMPVALSHHLFVDGIDRERAEQAWQRWLNGLFA